MSKRLKMLTTSLFLSCIMVVSFAGAAFAGGDYGTTNGNSNWEDNTPLECPDRDQDPAQDGSCKN
ncbi:hypothetical protein ACFLTP_02195 [Chloroflexota bacterium]